MDEPSSAIPADIRSGIESRLADIEHRHGVVVFLAVESGSRAWDFASSDSDYDVRFLYRHPRDWYLSLWERRDVIETPIEGVYDVNGWDLRKALRLAAKGNPVLYEWLMSPIRYIERPLAERFRRSAFEYFDPAKAYHHYLRTAAGQVRMYMRGPTVAHKKYFYAVRPLIACHFLLDHATAVPMRFAELTEAVDLPTPVRHALAGLLASKRQAREMDSAARIAVLDHWIEEALSRLQGMAPASGGRQDAGGLEAFFLSEIEG